MAFNLKWEIIPGAKCRIQAPEFSKEVDSGFYIPHHSLLNFPDLNDTPTLHPSSFSKLLARAL